MNHYQNNKMTWSTYDAHHAMRLDAFDRVMFNSDDADLSVTLRPIEVRTFLVTLA